MNNSFICLDLGASSTRFCSDDGIKHWIPNNVTYIDPETVTRMEAGTAESLEDQVKLNLDLTIEKVKGESAYFPVRVLVGEFAKRYSSLSERPNGNMNKSTQKICYVNALVATAVSRLIDGDYGDQNLNDVYVTMALPPVEVKGAIDIVNQQLCGEYKVTFHMFNDTVVRLNIVEVKLVEESCAALSTFFFDGSGHFIPEHRKYMAGNTLSIDIGASTTDVAAALSGRYIDRTGVTFKVGGNNIRESVKRLAAARMNLNLSDEMAEQGVAEGRVRYGAGFKDISDIVTEAKRELATNIVNSLQSYFPSINIPISDFMAFVVSGGGSMRGEYCDDNGKMVKTSEPVSYFITEKLKEICDGVDVFYIEDNPRLANLRGMYIRAVFAKRERMKKAGQI